MIFEGIIAWLPLVGGVSGVIFIVYAISMIYFQAKKNREIQELRRELAEVKGILLGGRNNL